MTDGASFLTRYLDGIEDPAGRFQQALEYGWAACGRAECVAGEVAAWRRAAEDAGLTAERIEVGAAEVADLVGGVWDDERSRSGHVTRTEAIAALIVAPIAASGETSDPWAEYDIEAIADEVLTRGGPWQRPRYFQHATTEEFWQAVKAHVRGGTESLGGDPLVGDRPTPPPGGHPQHAHKGAR